jgi:D-3-phosphoglycerate dehydrogenase
MSASIEPLILDLVEWVAAAPRPYREVIEAWRTSCPRLTVWEDAMERGWVACEPAEDGGLRVVATPEGRTRLAPR